MTVSTIFDIYIFSYIQCSSVNLNDDLKVLCHSCHFLLINFHFKYKYLSSRFWWHLYITGLPPHEAQSIIDTAHKKTSYLAWKLTDPSKTNQSVLMKRLKTIKHPLHSIFL